MSNEKLPVPLPAELDALFGQYIWAGQAKGLTYGLVGPDGLVHSAGFGALDDAGTAPDLSAVFPIASMSKSFVAAAALLARDRGLVDLEAPIDSLIPEFRGAGTFEESVRAPTLRMLLSMSGGLTEDNSWVDPFIGRPTEELLAQLQRGVHYSTVPGTTYEYSNLGFTLAGIAVGRAVDRPIEDFVHSELLAPLGMSSTWFDNRIPDSDANRATGYSLDADGHWVGYPPAQSDAFAAAGGMQSTVADLAVWVRWLAAAFRPSAGDDDGPLSRASRREMQRLHQINLPALMPKEPGAWKMSVGGYGLGLAIAEDLHRGTIVSHSGGLPGFLLNMTWHPESGHGVVVLTNSHRGNPIALAEQALYRVLDRHSTPARTIRMWPATGELRAKAEQLIRSWDEDLAQEIFAENIDFDRPLAERRAEVHDLIEQIGPLLPSRESVDVLSVATPADVTWSIPGTTGELICMIHLTPVNPPQIQEFEVRAAGYDTPRSARPTDISPRRAGLGVASLSSLPNNRIEWPVRRTVNTSAHEVRHHRGASRDKLKGER